MTHTCHRRGTPEGLLGDYVILPRVDPAVPEQLHYSGPLPPRMRRLAGILTRHEPLALDVRIDGRQVTYRRSADTGASGDELQHIAGDPRLTEVRHAVYGDRDPVEEVLREVKEANLGISIVVSGLLDEVERACRSVGLRPRAAHLSLGTWGRTDLLPDEPTLELCTMCGHGLLSAQLVSCLVDMVKAGEVTTEDAANELCRPCVCNVVNMERANAILKELCR